MQRFGWLVLKRRYRQEIHVTVPAGAQAGDTIVITNNSPEHPFVSIGIHAPRAYHIERAELIEDRAA